MPETPGIEVSVVGGDAFLRVVAEPGVDVVVLGYQQEPYLHIHPDGVVEENQRSPATYLNADRYGTGTPPAGADPTLAPNWEPVGSGGAWAWHDHRAHWMSAEPPAGAEPRRGGPVEHGADARRRHAGHGQRVDDVAGRALAGAARRRGRGRARRRPARRWPAGPGGRGRCSVCRSVAAAASGYWQFRSLPPETGPLLVWWLLPAIAAVSSLVALLLGRRLVSYALVLLAALELAVWVWLRRDAAFRAIIPTDAPVLARPRCAGGDRGRRRGRRRRRRCGHVPPASGGAR